MIFDKTNIQQDSNQIKVIVSPSGGYEGINRNIVEFKNEIEDQIQSLQDTTARYAFDTLQEAQDKWDSFSQEEKDELDGKTFTISKGEEEGEYKWDSSETGGVAIVGDTARQKALKQDAEILGVRSSYDRTRRINYIGGEEFALGYNPVKDETLRFIIEAPSDFQVTLIATREDGSSANFLNINIVNGVGEGSFTFPQNYTDLRARFSPMAESGIAEVTINTDIPSSKDINEKVDALNQGIENRILKTRNSYSIRKELNYSGGKTYSWDLDILPAEPLIFKINTPSDFQLSFSVIKEDGSPAAIKNITPTNGYGEFEYTPSIPIKGIRVYVSPLAETGTLDITIDFNTSLNQVEKKIEDVLSAVRTKKTTLEGEISYNGGQLITFPGANLLKGEKLALTIDTGDIVHGGNSSFVKESGEGNTTNLIRDPQSGEHTILFTADENYTALRWYCSEATGAGTMSYKIEIDTSSTEDKEHLGRYVFGEGLTFDIDTPIMPAFDIPLNGERLAYYYGLYDDLMSQYPDYISKIDCDEDSGITTPSYMNGYPIYMYKFKPSYTPPTVSIDDTSTQMRELKCMITSGVHPEQTSIYDLYLTMKLICEQWQTDVNLEAMRWNVTFYVMPCVGAHSVETSSRTNYNGVDLNRNAETTDWRLTEEGTNVYSGPYPGSEYETQIIQHYIKEIKPALFIDHHNFGAHHNKNQIYISSHNPSLVNAGAEFISKISRKWKEEYDSYPSNAEDSQVIFGFAFSGIERGYVYTYAHEQGALACVYESCDQTNWNNGVLGETAAAVRTSEILTQAVDGFVNFLVKALHLTTKIK